MPDSLGFWSASVGGVNTFLFGDFGRFYPLVLLPLNFIFYRRAYSLDNVKKSEFIGLCIAFVASALLFAILSKDAGYIPEVLYTIVGFVFGRLGTGFLSLFALILALVLVFPRFVELVLGVRVNLEIFSLIDNKIRQTIGEFFGGKDEKETLPEPNEIKPSEPQNEREQAAMQEYEREFIIQTPKESEIQRSEPQQELEFAADEPNLQSEFEPQNEPREKDKIQPRRTPNEIAEELKEQFEKIFPAQHESESKIKKIDNFVEKAGAEFDESELQSPQEPKHKPYVNQKYLPKGNNQGFESENLDEPSFQRQNGKVTPVSKDESKPFEVIERESEKKAGQIQMDDEFVPQVREFSAENAKESKALIKTEVADNAALLDSLEKGTLEPPKDFKLPPLEFLVQPSAQHLEINEQEIDKKIYDLLEKLRRFKIGGDVISTYTGPVVTTFEFRPSADVKVSRIMSLQDDLAMALRATSIRIQAPIPGKDVVGIEVPNEQIQTIYLREILESEVFKNAKSPLTIALGKDIVGNAFITDLKKLPHLLIAGTTGSGKSVGINAMLLSLLYRNSPKNLRLMMIDPKMLEFSIYNDIPHLLTPVITDPKKAIIALSNMVAEMERRYKLMAEARTKNIENYNDKMNELGEAGLPFIVVIIDELADLMMTAGKDVEFYIGRLAQMARASGIHLIVATQRPSVDVVTGLIKANLPSRLAYKVGQRIDSKVILDAQGAESLLGRGDSLFTPPGTSNLVRLHAPFASEMEIEKIVEFLKAQQSVEYDENFLKDGSSNAQSVAGAKFGESEGLDELFEQAKAVILEDKKTSISYLQRRLNIGYNRAANIIEQLSEAGVLSQPNAKGQREILI